MRCNTVAINLPTKPLKMVKIGEVFSMGSPTALPHVRIMPNIGDRGFTILSLNTNEFYVPLEETMEERVWMLDAVIMIKMIER